MSVGEVIALLCKYCSDADYLLMRRAIYEIEVDDDYIIVCFKDGNIPDIKIERKEEC